MFTGIIETTGLIIDIITAGSNKTFWIASPISAELTVDQSISHNGVCLTVEEAASGQHRVTAIKETLLKTNLGNLFLRRSPAKTAIAKLFAACEETNPYNPPHSPLTKCNCGPMKR